MNRLAIALSFALLACARPHAKPLPDGSYAIECESHKVCMDRAERQCGDVGYVIVSGEHSLKVYGAPGNSKVVGKDELRIRCKSPLAAYGVGPTGGGLGLSTTDAGTPATPLQSGATVCRAGETQKCFGPGACEGGQSCKNDGSGFGPCDCGAAKPPPAPGRDDAGVK